VLAAGADPNLQIRMASRRSLMRAAAAQREVATIIEAAGGRVPG